MTEARARRTPEDVVVAFLRALEAGDLETARAALAPDIRMVFPGGSVFNDLSELAAWSAPRYRRVGKHVERIDVSIEPRGAVLFVQGALHGEWHDGTPFSDIRFADWFLVVDGLIREQRVWNDLAIHAAMRDRR